MKSQKVFAATACLVLFFLFCSSLPAAFQSDNQKVRVKVSQAVIRFDPSPSSSAVATVEQGEILDVLQTIDGWYNVIFTSAESNLKLSGYIMASDVESLVDILSAPAIQTGGTGTGRTAPVKYKFPVSGKILCTTADFSYDYDIKGIITHIQFVESTGRDPVRSAITSGMADFEINAMEMEGDAVVGLSYDVFRDPADNRLYVLIYGTVVTFK
jgi:hypothetical protein